MEETELSPSDPNQGDRDKKSISRERAPSIMAFRSPKELWATFALIYVVSFLIFLTQAVVLSLTPHITSQFSGHSSISTLSMTVKIVSGVLLLPMAKLIDEFGRAHGFLMAIGLTTLGLAVQTSAQSLGTTNFARILYGIGWNLMDYVLTIVLADMTTLKNRALAYGIYVTPAVITGLAGRAIAEQLSSQFGWQAVLGVSTLVLYFASLPLVITLFRAQPIRSGIDATDGNTTKADQEPSHRERRRPFVVDHDTTGVILAIAGFLMFLLPSLHMPATLEAWRTETIITMIMSGFFCLAGFALWESRMAPVPCVPWSLLKDRNVLGGCLVSTLGVACVACWGSYYNSWLQVVQDKTATSARYINDVHPFSYALIAPMLGFLVRVTGNYKVPAFFAAFLLNVCWWIIMIFPMPGAPLDVLVLGQILVGFSERLLIACSQIAVMGNIDHRDVASAVAIWGLFVSIAVAIGSGHSGWIWTSVLPNVLKDVLPADAKNMTMEIAGSLEIQTQNPMGNPIRDAVIRAYWDAEELTSFSSAFYVFVSCMCVVLFKSIDVRKRNDRHSERAKGLIW